MRPNPQFPVDLVTFIEEILFLGSVMIILLAQIHFSIYPRNENIYVLLISTLAIT